MHTTPIHMHTYIDTLAVTWICIIAPEYVYPNMCTQSRT